MDNLLQAINKRMAFNVIRSKCGSLEKLEQTELSLINTPWPSVPQLTSKPKVKLSYLPVLHCHGKTEKKRVAGIRLQNVTPTFERVFGKIQSYFNATISDEEITGPRETVVVAPQPPPFQMKGNQQKHVGKSMAKVAPRASAPQHGRGTRAATFTTADSAPQNFTGSRVGNKPKVDSCRIQNLPRKYSENCEELMTPSSAKTLLISSLENFSSKDWKKHMEGLLQLKTLAQDHPAILKDRLQQVCVKICSEISSNRSAVSCEAMETMGVLYEHLPPDMNRLVDLTGVPLLARFASLQGLRERATITLEKMVDHCNPNKVLDFLLSKGMSHRCGAVRDGTAYLLTLLAKKMGITKILKSKSFIIVITKMCLDSSPKTRAHGYALLNDLDDEAGTEKILALIDEKNRNRIKSNLRKARKQ